MSGKAPKVPSFADVARKIGNDRLERALRELAINVETEIHNATAYDGQFAPKRSVIRKEAQALRSAAEEFEKKLIQLSKRFMDLPIPESKCLLGKDDECLSDYERLSPARRTIRDVIALCEKTLSIIPAMAGVSKRPGRVTCALIVVEAWTFAQGETPKAGSSKAQEACEDYWRACGQPPIGAINPANWRPTLAVAVALAKRSALRRHIRDEIRRCME